MNRIHFKGTLRGQAVDLYTLRNKSGLLASVTNYGARLVELRVPDRSGEFDNIVVGHSSMEDFLNHSEAYFGAVVGRSVNRIANGTFWLKGKKYQLDTNEGKHHLHGGPEGFHQVIWGANQVDSQTLKLSYRSVAGEGQYPGNLGVSVIYKLTDKNKLHINFQAESDAPTILNMSQHAYWNLHGTSSGASIYDHYMMINADAFTPVDSSLIPTGEIRPVEGTPMDFRSSKPIGRDREAAYPQLSYGSGYDHNYVLNKKEGQEISHAARVEDPVSGRTMDVYTSEPGIQFYECREPVEGIHSAFCLEAQHFPDSPNHRRFPPVTLEAYTPYRWQSVLDFNLLPQ